MAEEYGPPIVPEDQPKAKSNTMMIVIVVIVVVLCCCCLIVGGAATWLWYNGDQLIQDFGSLLPLGSLLA